MVLRKGSFNERLKELTTNHLQSMRTIAEVRLNPKRYYLSKEAKKRLNWMHLLYYTYETNGTKASGKIGISREWLSHIKNIFEKNHHDPRSLEPVSRAPWHSQKRIRISSDMEKKIIETRDIFPALGKEKIQWILCRDYGIKIGASTINRYLKKHHRICQKLSEKNKQAWARKKEREQSGEPAFKVKYRPYQKLKDYAPGALIEKDMKYVLKQGSCINGNKYKARENFYYQHTEIDSFTRIRTLEIVEKSDSATALAAHQRARKRFPFPLACMNTDNGSENEGLFSNEMQKNNVFHFYSSRGTPTDNPRVERSHRTDDDEFYQREKNHLSYDELKKKMLEWEHTYNTKRPHQALGYLTPMEFYFLWKKDHSAALIITHRWQKYLLQQRKRLASSRRIKRTEQIEALMKFIDRKLSQKVDLKEAKVNLIHRELCSWT